MASDPDSDRLDRQREGDRRFFIGLLGFLAALVLIGVVGVVYVLAFTGKDFSEGAPQTATQAASTQPQASTTTTTTPTTAGKDQFASTCGGCHTLAAAGTTGTVGPNLDQLKPDQATVVGAIQSGPGAMPSNLLTKSQAQQVAAFVAANAGH
jgi:mono/diheme cytochrome c family protein